MNSILVQHMGQISQDGDSEQNVAYSFYFLKLFCDLTASFVQVFSTVLKRFFPLHSGPNIFFYYLKKIFCCPKSNLLAFFVVGILKPFCNRREQLDLNQSAHHLVNWVIFLFLVPL